MQTKSRLNISSAAQKQLVILKITLLLVIKHDFAIIKQKTKRSGVPLLKKIKIALAIKRPLQIILRTTHHQLQIVRTLRTNPTHVKIQTGVAKMNKCDHLYLFAILLILIFYWNLEDVTLEHPTRNKPARKRTPQNGVSLQIEGQQQNITQEIYG